MSENKALIAIGVAMVLLVVAAAFALGAVGARSDVVVAVLMFIGCGSAFASSAVVGHYAEREKRQPPSPHNPPASG